MTGIRKFCVDGKRCGLGLSCEHAQVRPESCEAISMWVSNTPNTCENWEPRKELQTENDLRSAPRIGGRRRNRLTGKNLLPQPPDLMVTRHIKDGRNIKGDD